MLSNVNVNNRTLKYKLLIVVYVVRRSGLLGH